MPVSNICSAVNRPAFSRVDGPVGEVDGFAKHVHHAPERRRAHRHRDRPASVDRLHAALHAVGRLHRDGSDAILAQVLLHFADDVERRAACPARRDSHRVIDRRQLPLEFDVHDWADHLDDLADSFCCCCCHIPIARGGSTARYGRRC
jgi:hypothetical protein